LKEKVWEAMQIFVLLFNARTDNEGIHTLKVGDRNIVFMFESEDDATRFALMLEAQDFVNPTVEAFEVEEIEEFCQGADYDCKLVPEGTLVVPPETSVEQTDWQPEGSEVAEPEDSDPSEIPSSELDQIRRRLEGLL
jgi:Protein of unknown function (DUF3110)